MAEALLAGSPASGSSEQDTSGPHGSFWLLASHTGAFPTQVAHTRFLLCSGVPLPFLFMLPFLQHLPLPPAPTSGLHPASCTVLHPPLLLESMQLLLWPPDDPRFHLLPAWFLSPNEVIKFLGPRDLNVNNFERLGHFPHLPCVHRYDIQNPFCSPS